MKLFYFTILLFLFTLMSCDTNKTNDENIHLEEATKKLPYFKFNKENSFPGDGSLLRAEDGLLL